MILFLLFFILFLHLYIFKGKNAIIYVPIIALIIDIAQSFMGQIGEYSRASVLLHYLMLALFFMIIFDILKGDLRKRSRFNFGVFIFIIYLFILIPNSSDIWWTTKRILTSSISVLFLLGGYYYFKSFKDLRKLLNSVVVLIIIFEINVLISSIFNIGYGRFYEGEIIYLGSVILWSCYGFVFSLILFPLFSQYLENIKKYFLIILLIAGIIILLLIVKRAFIYAIILGFGSFFYFTKPKRKVIKVYLPVIILLLFSFKFLEPKLISRFRVRLDVITRNIIEEGRVKEVLLYPEVVQTFDSHLTFLLFGKDLFNSQGKYNIFEYVLNDEERRLHSDFTRLLYGAGIIGIIFYLIIFYKLFKKFRYYKKFLPNTYNYNILIGSFYAIFISLIFVEFAGGVLMSFSGFIPFLYLGAILGVIRNYALISINSKQYDNL